MGITGSGYGGVQGGQNMSSFIQLGCPIDRLIINNLVIPADHNSWPAILVDSQANIGSMILSNAIFATDNPITITGVLSDFTSGATNIIGEDLFNGTLPSNYRLSQFATPSGGGPVSAPTFSPNAGSFTESQLISLSSATLGATIYYTTDGTNPSEVDGTVYAGAFSIDSTTTIKAIAYKSGMTDSSVSTGVFTIEIAPSGGTAPTDFIAFYNFNDADPTAGLIDQTSAFNGTASDASGLTSVSGKVGNAVLFDGSGYYSVGSPIPNTPADFTITGWFKTSAGAGAASRIITKGTDGTTNQFNLYYSATYAGSQTGIQAYFTGNNTGPVAAKNNLNNGAWHFFAVKYNATTHALSIKADGTSWVSVTDEAMPTTTAPVIIGGADLPFAGAMDQIRIYNRLLTDQEVTDSYGGGGN